MNRLIPQWLASRICGWRGHRQSVERQVQQPGLALLVRTCRCGQNQDARVYRLQYPVKRG